jgi:hypothetical protein
MKTLKQTDKKKIQINCETNKKQREKKRKYDTNEYTQGKEDWNML